MNAKHNLSDQVPSQYFILFLLYLSTHRVQQKDSFPVDQSIVL